LTHDRLERTDTRHDETIRGLGRRAIRRQRHSRSDEFERLGGGMNVA
jgi:hypothetical protein